MVTRTKQNQSKRYVDGSDVCIMVRIMKPLLLTGCLATNLSLSLWASATPAITLLNQNPAVGDRMGYAVSIDGDYAVVGTRLDDAGGLANSGSVEIFKLDASGDWIPHQTLVSINMSAQHHFGHSVGISGDFIIVGEEKNSVDTGSGPMFRAGAAHLYKRDGITDLWVGVSSFLGNTGDFAGRSVAIDGDNYLVGVINNDDSGANAGTAFVFEFNTDGNPIFVDVLTPASATAGDSIGNAVSISGNHAVVGAFKDDGADTDTGSVSVWYNSGGGNWTEMAELVADDAVLNDQFGFSVSIDGDTIAVGSRLADTTSGNQVGAVYVYEGSDTDMNDSLDSWTQVQKLTASDAVAGDRLGTSVAVDGDRLISGAPQADKDASNDRSGKAYVFIRDMATGMWGEETLLVDSETTTRDEFGIGVALDGPYALVGSWLDNRPQNNSGAAYMFESYEIGDIGPGGGIVFSMDGTGFSGLEVARVDQPNAPWCADPIDIPGVDNITSIFIPDTHSGVENTAAIIAHCPIQGSAAQVASGYTWPNGQSDGFLPNKDELLMLLEIDAAGGAGIFLDPFGFYWSSTEAASISAWVGNPPDNVNQFPSLGADNKQFPFNQVRAVRSF